MFKAGTRVALMLLAVSLLSNCHPVSGSQIVEAKHSSGPWIVTRKGVSLPLRLENKEVVCYKYNESLQCRWKHKK